MNPKIVLNRNISTEAFLIPQVKSCSSMLLRQPVGISKSALSPGHCRGLLLDLSLTLLRHRLGLTPCSGSPGIYIESSTGQALIHSQE